MGHRVLTLLLAFIASAAALAGDADPPTRVARLSLIQGTVSFQASGAGAPEEAQLNRPLTWGDRLLTERGSRAEMSVGTAAIRLDEHTDLTIANLDEDIAQLELNSGTLGIHVRELRDGETFEIDTPNAAVLLLEPGDYRIGVDQGATLLAVRSGEAELDGGAGPVRVRDQQELRFTGPEQLADVQALGPLTTFDEWCIERERTLAERQATRYVSREVVGYEDLDTYGRWWNEPGYGYVWAPTYVSIGWAPYRFGHWAWIGPWGFTWIDHSPWGYAPFHYGRWAYLHHHHRWCWVPGPRHHRPVWAPALVGWHGMPGVRDPSHPRAVKWFPLGPREVYVPGHGASPRYLRAVNVSNTIINSNAEITNAWRGRVRNPRFANRSAPDALTSLPAAALSPDRFAGAPVVRVDPNEPESARPRAATPRPGPARDTRGPDAVNGRSVELSRGPPASKHAVESEQRRAVPSMPTERRVVQVFRTERDSPAHGMAEERRTEPPPARAHTEQQRAIPVESRRPSRGQLDRPQPTSSRRAYSDSDGSSRGGAPSAGFRAERAGNGGDSRASGSRMRSGRDGLSSR